jgi:hypothetical protein
MTFTVITPKPRIYSMFGVKVIREIYSRYKKEQ